MKLHMLLFVFLCLFQMIYAQSASEQFASRLFEKGEYRSSALEYERCIFTFPDSNAVPFWHYKIGVCSMREGHYTNALPKFKGAFATTALADSAYLFAGTCALRLNQHDSALNFFSKSHLDEAVLLSGYSHFARENYTDARKLFASLSGSSSLSFKAQSLEMIVNEATSFKKKHYAPAALLSVVPGLGHLYTHRTGDAIMTALTVTTGALITGYYAYHGSTSRAWATGTITGLFHAGGMFGAIVSVKLYNKNAVQERKATAFKIVFDQ